MIKVGDKVRVRNAYSSSNGQEGMVESIVDEDAYFIVLINHSPHVFGEYELEVIQPNAIHAIEIERKNQDDKWGKRRDHTPETWMAILTKQMGQAAEAVLNSDTDDLLKQLTHVAAVAVAAIESGYRNGF